METRPEHLSPEERSPEDASAEGAPAQTAPDGDAPTGNTATAVAPTQSAPTPDQAAPAGSDRRTRARSLRSRRRKPNGAGRNLLWSLPLLLLTAVWLWLAFSSGGFLEHQWLPQALVVSLFAFVVYLLIAYPRRPRQLSMTVIGFFSLYAVWVALSAIWAPSVDRVWEEAGRTFTYLLILTLALTYLTETGARRTLRYLLLAGGLILVGVSVWKLASAGDHIGALFFGRRFFYPTSYTNSAAALYVVLFWPLLWIAADPGERALWRGVSLATCWGLLALAVLAQSRGAAWTLGITVVLAIIISPVRLRTLVFLLVPAALMVGAFPRLNSYWQLGPEKVDAWTAPRAILVGVGVALLLGVALAILERWVHVSRRMRLVFGIVLVVAAAAAGIYGWVQLEERVGPPVQWVQDTWDRFTAEEDTTIPGLEGSGGPSSVSTRLAIVSASGRWTIWRTAWRAFEEGRWLGVGAGNYTLAHDRLRDDPTLKPRQPHSLELRLLSETGIVGATLFGLAVVTAIGGALWPRFGAGWRWMRATRLSRDDPAPPDATEPRDDHSVAAREQPDAAAGRWGADPRWWSWNTFLVLGVFYWLIHGSVDWLWHQPGVTVPALLMLALAVATTDARAEVLWPRWQRMLADSHRVTPFLMPPMVVMMRRRMGTPVSSQTPGGSERAPEEDGADAPDATARTGTKTRPGGDEDSITIVRRTDRHEDRWRKEARRDARRRRRREMIRPPGGVSVWFRRIAVVVAAVVFVGLAAPYVSSRLQETALQTATTDNRWAMRYVALSHLLQPADPSPFLTKADAYTKIADTADPISAAYREGLALALLAHIRAIEQDPAWWVVHYQAGDAAVLLLDAMTLFEDAGTPDGVSSTRAPFADYAWVPADERVEATALLALSHDDLRLLARSYYVAAQERNPLEPDVARALAALEESAAGDRTSP